MERTSEFYYSWKITYLNLISGNGDINLLGVTLSDDKISYRIIEYYYNGDIGINIQAPMPNFLQNDFLQIVPDIGYRTIFQRENYNREYHRNYFNYINNFYYESIKNNF